MGAVHPVLLAPTHDFPYHELEGWARLIEQRLEAGDRVVTLFGRLGTNGDVVTTAVLERSGGTLDVLRGHATSEAAFPSLTPRFPAMQMFERELWEQTGLVPDGHPWLKPVRYEGARQGRMGEHSFFPVRGQEIHEVGVGPIHAGVIEPGHFRFMCHGEQVHHLELQLGYQHRGVEAHLLARPARALAPLIESVAGDSSVAYAWGYCTAIEALSGTTVDTASNIVAGVALELERVAMHLATLSGLMADLAFLQGSATYGRLRTSVINATMRICGSRFGRGWLRPGGPRCGVTDDVQRDLTTMLTTLGRDMAEVNDLVVSARSVRARLRSIGIVSRQVAVDLGLVGLSARASGIAIDTRVSQPGTLYAAHPVSAMTEQDGDCWARMLVRMREVDESVRWISRVLDEPNLGLSDSVRRAPGTGGALRSDAVCVSVREGVRGPVVQVLETGGDGSLVQYKVQDPSLLNWFGLAMAVRNNDISDFPICNKSFDLSYCGNDL
ncbi:MAG: NADH-quinone oxidoreductase subunit C [Vicinamibacterales bacterium]